MRFGHTMLNDLLLRCKQSLESQLAQLDSEAPEDSWSPDSGDPADATMLRRDEALASILRRVAKRYPRLPLIAYGSRVVGRADAHSDLDILVLEYDRNAKPIHETFQINGLEIDVARVGSNSILKGIKGRSRNNNNWFLSALHECCIYADHEGEARRLRAVARQIRENGPPFQDRKHFVANCTALLRLANSAERLSARAGDSPEAARLARIRCDQLVTHSIYLFYCIEGRWTTSLHRLLERCRVDFPDLYALWLLYTRATEQETAMVAARKIVETACDGVISDRTIHEAVASAVRRVETTL